MKVILIFVATALVARAMPDYGDLASESYEVRREAQRELKNWVAEDPKEALKILMPKVREEEDPETRSRLAGLLREGFEMIPNGFMGIGYQEIVLGNGRPAILVSDVRPDSAALRTGLIAGDAILKVNGHAMDSEFVTDGFGVQEGFATLVQSYMAGEVLELEILRGAELLEKKLILGELPPLAERQMGVNPQLQLQFNQRMRFFNQGGLENAERFEREARFERWLKRNSTGETR